MVFDFYIAPGTVLKEYMEAREITQKDLAARIETSERHLSNLINGKVKLTEKFALKLEEVFPDVTAEMWMEIEARYQIKRLRETETPAEDIKQIAKDFKFSYLFKGLNYSLTTQYHEALKILGITSFDETKEMVKNLRYDFMAGEGKPEAVLLWIKLCESEVEIQNDLEQMNDFNLEGLKANMDFLKRLLYTEKPDVAIKNIRRFLKEYGIPLVIHEAVPTSRVMGATGLYNTRPVIFLSTLYNNLEFLCFALIHEIKHVLEEDYKTHYKIDFDQSSEEDKECLDIFANEYARNFFIDKKSYGEFVKSIKGKKANVETEIIAFSLKHKVIPAITLSFLQHDKIVEYEKSRHLSIPLEGGE